MSRVEMQAKVEEMAARSREHQNQRSLMDPTKVAPVEETAPGEPSPPPPPTLCAWSREALRNFEPTPAEPKRQRSRTPSAKRHTAAARSLRLGLELIEKWAIVPISDRKVPLFKGWPDLATRDPEQIERWARRGCEWGIPTGAPNRCVVVDIDDEARFAAECEARGWDLPATRAHRSSGGGRHLVYAIPDGVDPESVRTRRPPGADILAHRQQVMAPGCSKAGGSPVAVTHDLEQVPLPSCLLDYCTEPTLPKRHLPATMVAPGPVKPVPVSVSPRLRAGLNHTPGPGERRAATYSVCCAMADEGWDVDTIVSTIWNSPLGQKARERGEGWLRHEADRAVAFVSNQAAVLVSGDEVRTALDLDATIPGPARKLIIAMSLMADEQGAGTFRASTSDLETAAAMGHASVLRWLSRIQAGGWVRRMQEGTYRHASEWRMHTPLQMRQERTTRFALPPPTPPLHEDGSGPFLSHGLDPSHDGLRHRAAPRLIPVLTVLTRARGTSISVMDIATATGTTRRTVERHLDRLGTDGLVERVSRGHWRRVGDLTEGLDRAAKIAGTTGAKAMAAKGILRQRQLRAKALTAWREDKDRQHQVEVDTHVEVVSQAPFAVRERRGELVRPLLRQGYSRPDVVGHLVHGVVLPSRAA